MRSSENEMRLRFPETEATEKEKETCILREALLTLLPPRTPRAKHSRTSFLSVHPLQLQLGRGRGIQVTHATSGAFSESERGKGTGSLGNVNVRGRGTDLALALHRGELSSNPTSPILDRRGRR